MRWQPLLLSFASLLVFFSLAEAVLWLGGVDPLVAERDPLRGFSSRMRAYQLDPQRSVFATPLRARGSFNYQEFMAQKPDDGLRFFVLGGSSAFGFPWDERVAFTRVLRDALEQSLPGRKVEGINAGAMSYGSHRVRILASEVLDYQPDLLILYSGHNEFVEREFYRELIDRPEQLNLLVGVASQLRLFSVMTRAWEAASTNPVRGGDAGALLGLDVHRDEAVGVSDEDRTRVIADFETNLRAILDEAAARGVPVVLCTVPANLRGWRPNESSFASERRFEARESVQRDLAQARDAHSRGDLEAALKRLVDARDVAPEYAEIHFRLGELQAELGRYDEAYASYALARNRDTQPSRATRALNQSIRRIAGEGSALLVDIEQAFQRAAVNGLPGFDLFEDYVHPKPEAHRLIARELWKSLHAAGLLVETRSVDDAAFDRLSLERVADPLGEAGGGNSRVAAFLFNLGVVLTNQGRDAEAIEKFRACLERAPDYPTARSNIASLLYNQGRFREATREHSQALELDPRDLRALVGMGEALRSLGELQRAVEFLERATRVGPRSGSAWKFLGIALLQQRQLERAEIALRRAYDLAPNDLLTCVQLAKTLMRQGELNPAGQLYEECLNGNPDDPIALAGLARVNTKRGETKRAAALYRRILAINPQAQKAREQLQALGE